MSNDIQQNTGFGSNVASCVATPLFNGACIGVSALRNGKGVKGAIKNANAEGYKQLNSLLKEQGVDVFTRSEALAIGHDKYKEYIKTAASADRKIAKLEKRGLSIKQRITNIFKKDKVTAEGLKDTLIQSGTDAQKKAEAAKEALSSAGKNFNQTTAKRLDETLETASECFQETKKVANAAGDVAGKAAGKAAKEATEEVAQKAVGCFEKIAKKTAQEGLETGFKATAKGFGGYVKNNFKKELSWKHGKFNIVMTALQFIPNVINDVIPTFKEKGFKEGMKATGKTLVKAGTDLVSYAAGGALGRAIGAAVGSVICPGVGTRIGATVGDMVMSMVVGGKVTSTVDKIVDGNKKEETEQVTQENQSQENISEEQIAQNTNENLATDSISNPINQTPVIDEKPKSRYIKPQNGVYHTAWVNELNKERIQREAQVRAQQLRAQQVSDNAQNNTQNDIQDSTLKQAQLNYQA